ncbi:prenyltransferase/squalene oxidase repeat-containing protein [Actinoplanes oblitus]|uniref:Prenyltransferase/squalene oxidase repeat-containing protein n=1 Tax=Actinoplanes oblitus TaxID=3040509 RepID=A0ABY8WGR4_9ACTN|nr:prenyltransferase/squalene oxidase repeat-containing protein [Actinoplanes oblitus]WIM97061.1 prenyltransferase/squalene oxidase repeat-containing protein [Actinoplanes oblitus]
MVDIDAAIGYVVAHGDPVERARLSYLRTGQPAPSEIIDRIAGGQMPEGGWPASADGQVPSVDATCFRLAELDDLGGLQAGPVAERALHWLASAQRPGGTWQEHESLAGEAPAWALPGDPEATLYLTSVAGFWLTAAAVENGPYQTRGRYDEVLAAAAGFVVSQLRPDGTWPSFLAAGWHAAGLLYQQQYFYESSRVQLVLGERLPDMSPADVAAMAAALRRVNLGDDWLLRNAWKRLGETQRTDGGWDSNEGPIFDVNITLTVLRAFR